MKEGKQEYGVDLENLKAFEEKIRKYLNYYSLDGAANTPDFILAKYLIQCYRNYLEAKNSVERWNQCV